MYKIYKIIDNTNDNIYVGSTRQKLLSTRLAIHKYRKNCRAYEIIKNCDYKIQLIEETEDKSRERYWIETTENCINKNIPCRTKEEIKEYQRKYQKIYREKNKIT